MRPHQKEFIEMILAKQVLRFGDFTLKSGRTSPYFFNAGLINDGLSLARLGAAYAQAIIDSGAEFDMLFGPAYKGIPLATATAVAFADRHRRNVPLAYNRKEAKSHGEGGTLVGAPLEGRVLIVDDVLTAGTAVRESINLIRNAGARPAGVVLALDRQERGQGSLSAVQEIQATFGIPVIRIIALDHLIQYLEGGGDSEELEALRNHRRTYGVDSEA
ncbi:MAG TPA: orotate phosphoribosyltransferase [Steroidobacteraceae bacterium]|jgi:orotate phosphoribosyltransferase|nr:orotate phosphoribosyltransferase [Steroidobacteraceae bacterium]